MHIQEIILDGFKCYEKKTCIKNLDKSYNAITGLNGSGKSNIIDGIIFVLGLENKKLLRTNTLKELININRKDCKVTLILNNNNNSVEDYGKEIILGRYLDETGKSKFYLNNHLCSLNTIQKLCVKFNLNAEKGDFFFCIMQGQITKILNMKNKEISNLIEETAGTRSYTKEKEKGLFIIEKKEIKLIEVKNNLEKRISPFYNRLREERELYIKLKNSEKTKIILLEEKNKIEKYLKWDDISRSIVEIRKFVQEFKKDKFNLINLEKQISDLEDLESDENIVNLKDQLEEEKIKLNEIRKICINDKIKCINNKLMKIKDTHNLYDLVELKEKENFLIRKLKNEGMNFGNQEIDVMEEMSQLKNKKTELNFRYQNILQEINKKKEVVFKEPIEFPHNSNNANTLDKTSNSKNTNLDLNNNVDSLFIENKIKEIEKYKIDINLLEENRNKLKILKNRLLYRIQDKVYGTVDENINITDDKYKEAVFTCIGGRSKHIIVEDEYTGSSLLNQSDRRISVIPLNKIKTKYIENNLIKQVKSYNGIHIIEIITFDYKLNKAIEHIFNGIFVFTDSTQAKRACFDCKVVCITLDGNVYDPKGTLTGGSSTFKIDITKQQDIIKLENIIRQQEQDLKYFEDKKKLYENLLLLRKFCQDKHKLQEELKFINIKINSMVEYSNTIDIKKELGTIRMKIIEGSKEEALQKENQNKKYKYEQDLKDLMEEQERVKEEEKNCKKKIDDLQKMLNGLELKSSAKRLSMKQIDGLEPKQKFLIKQVAKLRSEINKLKEEILIKFNYFEDEAEKEGGEKEKSVEGLINKEELMASDYSQELDLDQRIFTFNTRILKEEEFINLQNRLSIINSDIKSFKETKSIRMDPSNFDLLEKNEMIIQSLKNKIALLEKDKASILNSINNFDLLGIKENERAFNHLNKKVGTFFRYFLQDGDVKIERDNGYELKVKVGNWKNSLSELSGGQRSLVALCLIFSILIYRPAPFYIFDEIDAALDLDYTESIGRIIKEEFKQSQFIVVSLKNGMYENANSVFKVFLKDGKSNVCQIK